MIQSELAPWRADLVVERGRGICLPSFALAAFAAMRFPQAPMALYLDRDREVIQLRFSSDRSALAQAGAEIKLSAARQIASPSRNDLDMGIRAGDTIGHYAFLVPDNDVLDAATIGYHDVFAADDARVRQWFEGKLALIGDLRSSTGDRHRSNDGRTLSGPHLNAALIDSLLRDALSIRYPRQNAWLAVLLGSAFIGAIAAAAPRPRRRWRWLAPVCGIILIGAFSAAAFQFAGYLINPLGPALAMLLCFTALLPIRHRSFVGGIASH